MIHESTLTLLLNLILVVIRAAGDSRLKWVVRVLLNFSKSMAQKFHTGTGRMHQADRLMVVMIGRWSALRAREEHQM